MSFLGEFFAGLVQDIVRDGLVSAIRRRKVRPATAIVDRKRQKILSKRAQGRAGRRKNR
ncbi:hypothetical protein [Novosphingobium colocasiae]|uniref:hypothetical protein n=1 Tax=Novosphingobium colocasiae TaxID=1256513 RepID=UPI0035AD97D6